MRNDVPLGRIAGFPVSMNWSVLAILWLLTWSLADTILPDSAPGHTPGAYWAAGLVGAVLFFGSLLAHELAHAVVARRSGIEVKGLTLWLFGGVASLGGEPRTPRDEFRVAVVGPATSLGLAAGFAAVAVALNGTGAAHLVVAVAGWLGATNALLGIFNLVPGAPLDGGRLLRAYLWHRHGDRVRASISAAHAGRYVGYGLIGLGVLQFAVGAGFGGLWLALIGWFIIGGARNEEGFAVASRALVGVRVSDVMTRSPQTVPGWITVNEFIARSRSGMQHTAYPVEGFGGNVDGLVTLDRLRAVSAAARDNTRVADVAIPRADVPTAQPAELVVALLERVSSSSGDRTLVFEDDHLVGIVTSSDLTRAVELGVMRSTSEPPVTARP